MKEEEIYEIIKSYGEPTTEYTSLILSTDYRDMAKEIYEEMLWKKHSIDLI